MSTKSQWILLMRSGGERGAVAVYTALFLATFLGFTALAVDVGHLYGVKNELHNAADAGALAGAQLLYDDGGNLTVDAAKTEATRVVQLNPTGNQKVVEYEVQIGHWSFTEQSFQASSNTEQVEGWESMSFSDLDTNNNFINAVQVIARRTDTPSFFARILGFDQFFVSSQGVAYLGFAGTLYPQDVDEPIAVCEDSIKSTATGGFTCDVGRMIPSTTDTARWTDLTQPSVCVGSASNTEITNAINKSNSCDGGNKTPLIFGSGLMTNKGETAALPDLIYCWKQNSYDKTTFKWTPWEIVLPVISCTTSNCAPLVGAVRVRVVWINDQVHTQGANAYSDVPTQMGNWSNSDPDGYTRWVSFTKYFGLTSTGKSDGTPLPYQDKSIYFQTECEKIDPRGQSGGKNFGILAKYPKLVQ